ncbi:unnamed protein product [Effrenium voratum]|nr:unnamed protein product [Effrenium voratum]
MGLRFTHMPSVARLLALCTLAVAQPPQTGCVDDCLAEALADDPTRGCLPGEYWKPYPPTSPVSSCQPCPAGWYCTGIVYGNFSDYPVNLNRRTPCPPGTFRNVTSGVNLSDCEFCSPGYFSEVEASTACVACPAGTYSITAGSSKVADCVECPAGHFCLEATGRPTVCPAGSYVSFPGMTNESDCHNCTEGHYCQIGTVWPLECPKGSYGNTTGLRGNGSYPGTFLPDAWTDITPTGVEDTDCIACPAASFCVNGSVVPRQCPPGTFSNASSDSETDCEPCPEGYQCRFPVSSDLDQSSVARLPNGQLVAGSDGPELCPVDANVLHFSFPNVTGCVEHCPYQFPQQSYCHRPGDGRVPDRTSWALVVEQHLSLRSGNRAVEVRQTALLDLILVLQNLTAEEAANTLTMLDGNGRTALHKSAMMNDVEALDVLLQYGGASTLTINAARDADGFTALMQALLLDNTDASSWLVSNGAILTQADASLLNARGLDVAATGTSPEAAVLGRAGLPWTGPSAESFGGLGQASARAARAIGEPDANHDSLGAIRILAATKDLNLRPRKASECFRDRRCGSNTEREEEEAEFRSRALRVARRQLWRDRAVRRKHARSPVVSPPAGELRSQLADMYEEKSTLLETIEERRAELANLQKQQQAVRSEIALWSQRVTELEAKAVDARLQAAPQACAGMLRAESMPVLVQSPPVRPNSWLPPWAAMPPPPVHIPAYTAPLQGLSSSPGRVQTVRSFTSPRQAWSPGGSLVLPPGPGHVMSPGSSLSLQPGSMSLPGGMQVRHYGMVRTANSFSAGQLPKAAAMSPSPLGQGGGYRPGLGLSASSPSPSSRAGSPVARAHMVTQVVRGASPRPSPSPLQQR